MNRLIFAGAVGLLVTAATIWVTHIGSVLASGSMWTKVAFPIVLLALGVLMFRQRAQLSSGVRKPGTPHARLFFVSALALVAGILVAIGK